MGQLQTTKIVHHRTTGSGTTLNDEIKWPFVLWHGGRALRWCVQHPGWSAPIAGLGFLMYLGLPFQVALIVCVVMAWLALRGIERRARIGGADLRGPLQTIAWLLRKSELRKQWAKGCANHGITGPGTLPHPALIDVRPLAHGGVTAKVDTARVGLSPIAIRKHVAELADVTRCRHIIVTDTAPGHARVDFHYANPVGELLALKDMPMAPPGRLAYGRRIDGTAATIPAHLSVLIGGLTGMGKSNTDWALLGDEIRQRIPIRLYVSDTKGGMEFDVLQSMLEVTGGMVEVRRYETTVTGSKAMFKSVVGAKEKREQEMKARGVKMHVPTMEEPRVIVIIDELLMHTEVLKQGAASDLATILFTGRAAGYKVYANSQLGQVDAIGRARDFFPSRICYGTRGRTVTDAILGDTAESQGALCSAISEPGIGYSIEEGEKIPTMFRGAYVSPSESKMIAHGKLPDDMIMTPGPPPVFLYRVYDADDALLWVGLKNPTDEPWYAEEAARDTKELLAMPAEKHAGILLDTRKKESPKYAPHGTQWWERFAQAQSKIEATIRAKVDA